MTVVIIDYGSGNLRSAAKAFERAAAEAGCNRKVMVTSDPAGLRRASHIVLPGVGAFADCWQGLAALPDMLPALEEAVIREAKPFLGICVGMQLMATTGHEHGVHDGLGWIAGAVVPIDPNRRPGIRDQESRSKSPMPDARSPTSAMLKIPHMGWNEIEVDNSNHPVLADLPSGTHLYFVHGYHFTCTNPENVLATVDYGGPITAVVGRDNLVGTQFHPEKSQGAGLRLIANFLGWRP
ncbi:MAG: imidazole glycerol phosphate synthase subunit HisH [Alphaproteobacteria bacterium]